MEAIPSGVCQAAEGGKESEDGRGGCVVGGGGVGGRRQGRRSVRESEEGNEGERGCRGTVDPRRGGRWWLGSPSGAGTETSVRERER